VGLIRKFEKSKSIIAFRKSTQGKTAGIVTSFLLALTPACAQKSKKIQPIKAPMVTQQVPENLLKTNSPKQLPVPGISLSPNWSSDGRFILYSSRLRPGHKNAQIYEFDFTNNSERRITFSDGDALDPHYVDQEHIIYSSTTDEIKEHPFVIENLLGQVPTGRQPNSEIYLSQANGLEIRRLTKHPGFDGLLKPGQNKQDFYYTSVNDEDVETIKLHLINFETSINNPIFTSDHDSTSEFTASRGHFAWLAAINTENNNPEFLGNGLVLAEKSISKSFPVTLPITQYRDLFWSPGSNPEQDLLVMSGQATGTKFFAIYGLDLQRSCLIKLASSIDHNLIYPSISLDQKNLAYVASNSANEGQIYITPFDYSQSTCAEKVDLNSILKNRH
jgi:Tol biopolymer transport system component